MLENILLQQLVLRAELEFENASTDKELGLGLKLGLRLGLRLGLGFGLGLAWNLIKSGFALDEIRIALKRYKLNYC